MCSWMREKETCLSLLELAFRNISKSWSRLEGENEGHEKRKRSLSIFIMFTFQFCLISGGCKAIPFPFTCPSSSSNRLSKFIERQQIPKNYLVVDRGGGHYTLEGVAPVSHVLQWGQKQDCWEQPGADQYQTRGESARSKKILPESIRVTCSTFSTLHFLTFHLIFLCVAKYLFFTLLCPCR